MDHLEDYQGALKDFNLAIESDDKNEISYYKRGVNYYIINKFKFLFLIKGV